MSMLSDHPIDYCACGRLIGVKPMPPSAVAPDGPARLASLRQVSQASSGVQEPIEEGWCRDTGIDKNRPQTGTAVGERGHFGVVGSANGAKALSDQRRDVGVSLGDCSEHLPTSTRSFDIADANLHVTFALFAAADERRIHADSDQCCRSCWLVSGCNSKLRADPQRMVAQCLRAPTGVNGQQVSQYARSDAIGHQGGKMGLQFVQLRGRSATRWPTDVRLNAIAGGTSNRGSGTVTAPNSVAMWCPRQSFRWHFPLQAAQHGRCSPWLTACAETTAR